MYTMPCSFGRSSGSTTYGNPQVEDLGEYLGFKTGCGACRETKLNDFGSGRKHTPPRIEFCEACVGLLYRVVMALDLHMD